MPRVWVDKQTRTTVAIKKYVDNPYLIWFVYAGDVPSLWKNSPQTRPARKVSVADAGPLATAPGAVRSGFLDVLTLVEGLSSLSAMKVLASKVRSTGK
jgi:hypothetical protein